MLGHPNSSQTIYRKKLKKLLKKLHDMTGMDIMECPADTIASFIPMNHFNRFLILVDVALVLAIVTY